MKDRLSIAKTLVVEAGRLTLEIRRRGIVRVAKAQQDFVTEADKEAERFVREELGKRFPEDGILGEERGLELPPGVSSAMEAEGLWILDPIDGTTNFAAGIDGWCVSLAYVRKGIPEVGALSVPDRQELFWASRGQGAYFDDTPLKIEGAVPPSQALIMTGRGSAQPVEMHLEVLRRLFDCGFEYRRWGSGALGIAQVATGQIQGYVEPGMYAWDVAAARLIAGEAGAELTPFPFENPTTELGPLVVACQPGLLETLIETVRF